MNTVMEKLKYTTIFILIVWQQMYLASQVLTTFVNIIMTMPQVVLYIHVVLEYIISTACNSTFILL